MKKFLVFTLILCQLLCACTYHGKIHRGIYKHSDFEEKINARVMVVSDKHFPVTFSLEDAQAKYSYRLTDGLPIAVADALATLFTEVEVNEDRYRKNYDYIAEIEYQADISIHLGRFLLPNPIWFRYMVYPKLNSRLVITMRNPHTGYAVARYEEESTSVVPTSETDGWLWTVGFLKGVTLGLLAPLEVQVFGGKLRKVIEKNIAYTLHQKIMPAMADNRLNFTKEHPTEKTNTRVDGAFLPFMKATVYIHAGDSIGSGFFIDPRGYIVTNAHVVGDNRDVSVILYDERQIMDKTDATAFPAQEAFVNKVRFAKVLKRNKTRDLALLKVEGENFPWLELETNRQAYQTGKAVVAIGAPRSIEWSVAQGILSATRDQNGVDTLQTDTAINGGNSGGPLIDLQTGKVIGVNSWMQISNPDVVSLQRGTHGLNFAISAFEVTRTLGISQPINPDTLL